MSTGAQKFHISGRRAAIATSVYIRFDGADYDIPCHPDSIEYVGDQPCAA